MLAEAFGDRLPYIAAIHQAKLEVNRMSKLARDNLAAAARTR